MNLFSFSMILNLPSSPACIRDDEVSFFTAELFTFPAPLLLPPHNWPHKKIWLHNNSKNPLLALVPICKLFRSSCKCPLAVWLQIHCNSAVAVTSIDPGSFRGASGRENATLKPLYSSANSLTRSARTQACNQGHSRWAANCLGDLTM
ncbi:hypothetical protein PspLS_11706 [Pyricularia sp. CBS 133598]|nr:hypothetical protein PspLS_11706 [Pyricularia sp. CBS 133598]